MGRKPEFLDIFLNLLEVTNNIGESSKLKKNILNNLFNFENWEFVNVINLYFKFKPFIDLTE